MPQAQLAPYGTWASPLTSDRIVSATVGLSSVQPDGDDIYWLESRPAEGGRVVLVRRASSGDIADLTPAPFNVRTRVHEYGGGAYTVNAGTIYFSHFADSHVYRLTPGAEPQTITTRENMRYADFVVDSAHNQLIAVREDHTGGDKDPVNTLVGIALDGSGDERVLVSGNDFYSSPRLSPDGKRLAWITWNHPNMPWDGTDLWTAGIQDDGTLAQAQSVAGGQRESVVEPVWSPDGELHFASDRTGWWNLYRLRDGQIEALHPLDAEFARPHWVFGISSYAFATPNTIICSYTQNGIWRLARLDTHTGALTQIETPYTVFADVRATHGTAISVAGSPTEPTAVLRVDLESGHVETLRRSSANSIDAGYLSRPEPIEFSTEGGRTAYALFYPPHNQAYTAPANEKPPLLVMSHGGPTSAASTAFNPSIQYWTSRGIAVLDVNYGGSTGYGRPYRERLNGQWGIVDVDDCVNGARYLAERGRVDGDRLMITGGSAGGYTVLSALTFRDVFKAGASHYGVSNLEGDMLDTHKFESRYTESLVGPYPAQRDVYYQRSPINFTDRLSCPVIFFQGLDDKVVLPGQSELMVQALREKGVPVAYLPFEGEGHGFRRAENIKRSLDAELYFYGKVFGFTSADTIEPVHIDNI
ncbi:MAG TPA: S9 family peptidase [Ktedonobacterales bacterium]